MRTEEKKFTELENPEKEDRKKKLAAGLAAHVAGVATIYAIDQLIQSVGEALTDGVSEQLAENPTRTDVEESVTVPEVVEEYPHHVSEAVDVHTDAVDAVVKPVVDASPVIAADVTASDVTAVDVTVAEPIALESTDADIVDTAEDLVMDSQEENIVDDADLLVADDIAESSVTEQIEPDASIAPEVLEMIAPEPMDITFASVQDMNIEMPSVVVPEFEIPEVELPNTDVIDTVPDFITPEPVDLSSVELAEMNLLQTEITDMPEITDVPEMPVQEIATVEAEPVDTMVMQESELPGLDAAIASINPIVDEALTQFERVDLLDERDVMAEGFYGYEELERHVFDDGQEHYVATITHAASKDILVDLDDDGVFDHYLDSNMNPITTSNLGISVSEVEVHVKEAGERLDYVASNIKESTENDVMLDDLL